MAGKDLENLRHDAVRTARRSAEAIDHYVRSLTVATAAQDNLQILHDLRRLAKPSCAATAT